MHWANEEVILDGTSTQLMHVTTMDAAGSKRNAWPEYKGLEVDAVLDLLKQEDPKNNVFVQRPDSYTTRPRPSAPVNLSQDIWLYPDANGIVAIIPKRGLEHHSRKRRLDLPSDF